MQNLKDTHQNTEAKIATQTLDSLNYNNQNIAIPIVKIAKNYGLKTLKTSFFQEEKPSITGKLLIGKNAKSLYGHKKIILVNKNDSLFKQRTVIARMLGDYLMDIGNNEEDNNPNLSVFKMINEEEIYDKHEEFILNILAPTEMFIKEYNNAIGIGLIPKWIDYYLSEYFEVPNEFVKRKTKSLTKK